MQVSLVWKVDTFKKWCCSVVAEEDIQCSNAAVVFERHIIVFRLMNEFKNRPIWSLTDVRRPFIWFLGTFM